MKIKTITFSSGRPKCKRTYYTFKYPITADQEVEVLRQIKPFLKEEKRKFNIRRWMAKTTSVNRGPIDGVSKTLHVHVLRDGMKVSPEYIQEGLDQAVNQAIVFCKLRK